MWKLLRGRYLSLSYSITRLASGESLPLHLLGDGTGNGFHVGGHLGYGEGERLIPFTIFDVAFMTNLAMTGRRFDGEEVSGDLERMVRECMAEIVVAERGKWKCQKERRRSILRNYVRAMSNLCEENSEDDSMGGVLSYDEQLRRVYEDLQLEKENRKSVVKEVEKLEKHDDIPEYYQANEGPTVANHEGGVLADDDVHSPDEHYPESTEETATDEQPAEEYLVEVPVIDEPLVQLLTSEDELIEGSGTEKQSVQPTVEESAAKVSAVEVPTVEQSTEELSTIDVLPLKEPTVYMLEPNHLSAQLPPSVDLVIGVSGESVHFTADVHVIDVEISCTDDDGESIRLDKGDNEEPL
ncbi:LOW QUALITY PROTEIN: hypothetical protein Cgig2_028620 [Carnegiea gigantea]|uniref:Uncharacterized protein n=1 Tax=Carnegiea gigantea TaxID=171969 RepID=A0A9Q1QD22_9CARY|nr:LOW QUALITY PROTEIN: hypothetical protein Cgig2_028620 [Carnegiea gigantea]